jgi:hypothetical protein
MPNRPKMNFEEMGIKPGSVLQYRDDPHITVVVYGINTVLFSGKEEYLMPITKRIRGVTYDIRPAAYWTYDKRLLSDIYDETYLASASAKTSSHKIRVLPKIGR